MDALQSVRIEAFALQPRMNGCRVGRVVAVHDGVAQVDYPGNAVGPRTALRVAGVTDAALADACLTGRAVLLLFADNDASRPVIVDILHEAGTLAPASPAPGKPTGTSPRREASVLVPGTVRQGRVAGIEGGAVLVELPECGGDPVRCVALSPLRNLRDPVIVLQADTGLSIVLGQVLATPVVESEAAQHGEVVLRADTLTLEATRVLKLKAGNCTLELDAQGRAVLVGDQIVSRARTTNKVQGGSIQLN